MLPHDHPWKMRQSEIILNTPPWLVVENHVVELPGGQIIPDWTWVITPNFVNVVVQMQDGRYQFFRQWKYGFDRISLAPIGGYIEPNEAPLSAAKRELLEEMGCEADDWVDLGVYRVDANRGAGIANLFFARNAKKVAEPVAGDLEMQELITLTKDDVLQAIKKGDFRGLAWVANVALALLMAE
jgi:ADP-ribose pyrophosphatase